MTDEWNTRGWQLLELMESLPSTDKTTYRSISSLILTLKKHEDVVEAKMLLAEHENSPRSVASIFAEMTRIRNSIIAKSK